ncbi:MAG: MMPL family transporter [Alphaproteobacteria bacterium]|nr:MMPL family transporter [Alphaproteobacteria bacterium]
MGNRGGAPRVVRALAGIVGLSQRWAAIFVTVMAVVTIALSFYVAHAIRVDTSTEEVLSRDLPFRQQNIAFKALFPGFRDPLVIVLDGGDPDALDDAGRRLATRLRAMPETFPLVFDAASEPFFRRNGFLYLSVEQLSDLSDRLAESQAFLATLSGDPSLRGLFDMLRRAVVDGGEELAQASGMRAGLDALAATIEARGRGQAATLAWSTLMGGDALQRSAHRLIVAETNPDSGSLEPGAEAMRAARAAAAELGLAAAGVRMRLTGEAALSTEELEGVFHGAIVASVLSFVVVALIVVVGLRSWRLVLAVLANLVVGLVLTAAFATVAVGRLNLISVAFAVLFVGIAVDFGIHFALRYKEQLLHGVAHAAALGNTATGVGPSLLLAGLTALFAFFSFLPTSYRGVAELGLISGVGMIIATLTSLTVLPAILSVLPQGRAVGSGMVPSAAFVDGVIRRHARLICLAAFAVGLVALPIAAQVRFEKNPLNLQDPTNPSVQTLRDLMRSDPATRPGISVVMPTLEAAQPVAARLAQLPSVAAAITARSLVPADIERKLEIIGEMNVFLAPLLAGAPPLPTPTDGERRASIAAFIDAALPFAASPQAGAMADPLRRLANGLSTYLDGPGRSAEALAALEQALLGGLGARLDALREALGAEPVAVDDVPPVLLRQYLAPDGRARIEVQPRLDLSDDAAMRRFVAEVSAAAPNAVGPAAMLMASGDAVVGAFQEASVIALVMITIVLLVQLRSVVDMVLVLIPLLLAATITFAISATLGPPINFANIIVVPLLLGLGVSSGIYLVTRAREESDGMLLRTVTPRAVLFSALTTVASFGSLAIERHVGTASMGQLLMIAIALSLVCTLVVLPAMLSLRYGRRAAGAAVTAADGR